MREEGTRKRIDWNGRKRKQSLNSVEIEESISFRPYKRNVRVPCVPSTCLLYFTFGLHCFLFFIRCLTQTHIEGFTLLEEKVSLGKRKEQMLPQEKTGLFFFFFFFSRSLTN